MLMGYNGITSIGTILVTAIPFQCETSMIPSVSKMTKTKNRWVCFTRASPHQDNRATLHHHSRVNIWGEHDSP